MTPGCVAPTNMCETPGGLTFPPFGDEISVSPYGGTSGFTHTIDMCDTSKLSQRRGSPHVYLTHWDPLGCLHPKVFVYWDQGGRGVHDDGYGPGASLTEWTGRIPDTAKRW